MISRLEQGSLVTVFGGSGFVGRHAVRALARRRLARARGRAPARSCRAPAAHGRGRPDPCRAGQPALSRPRAPRGRGRRRRGEPGRHPRQVGPPDLRGRARGGRPRRRRGRARGRRQDPGARLGASAPTSDAKASYARTKAAGEAAVLRATFRTPSSCAPRWCSGRRTSSSIASPRMARFSPFLPLIGGGRTKLQPVYVGDVARGDRGGLRRQGQAAHDLRAGRPRGRHLPPAARPDHGVVGPQAPLSAHPLLAGQARRAAHRCRCPTACARSPSTRCACCRATTW